MKDSALIRAIQDRDLQAAKKAIRGGADVNATLAGEPHHITPLMLAAMDGKTEFVKLLVDAGADVKAKNKKGETYSDYLNADE